MKYLINKIKNIYKTKKILNAKQSILFAYIFLIWLVIKPSHFIKDLDYGLIKNIIFYAYEIIPLLSYLILTINSLIQTKKENFRDSKSIFGKLTLFPLILFLPIIIKYYIYIFWE